MKYCRLLLTSYSRICQQNQTKFQLLFEFSNQGKKHFSSYHRGFAPSSFEWRKWSRFYTNRYEETETADSKARTHFEKRLVPEHLYEVVKNVDEYKYFVPWCEDSRIIHKKGNEMDAELTVGFKILSEKYISHILLDPPNSIRVRSPETRLFEYLINEWYFKPGPDPHSTWLEFYVSFKFRSFLYQHIVDMFFEDVVKRMVTAFETRAKHVEEEKRAKHLEERVPWTK